VDFNIYVERKQTEAAGCDVVLVLVAPIASPTENVRPTWTLSAVSVALESHCASHVTLTCCI